MFTEVVMETKPFGHTKEETEEIVISCRNRTRHFSFLFRKIDTMYVLQDYTILKNDEPTYETLEDNGYTFDEIEKFFKTKYPSTRLILTIY